MFKFRRHFGALGALSALLFLPIPTLTQSTPTILCVPGQCLQGYSNTTIGATVTGASNSLHLLPGTYDASTNPQLLHDTLTSASASLSPSTGFNASSSISLPLTIALQPGVSFYANRLYSGQASFTPLPSAPTTNSTNSSTPITSNSLALSSNVWIALKVGPNTRVIIWDAVPDFTQLPAQGALALVDIQSAACSPTCSGGGFCSVAGQCQCQPGFSGASCETCAPGFFGPTCQPCPANCTTCDEGVTGTGRCLKPTLPANAPSNCNCKSGVCGANGTCSCSPGFTAGNDGTQCSKCLPGFFLTSSGDCQICQLGCAQCSDTTAECTSCKPGFGQNSVDKTKCDLPLGITSVGQTCPRGTFSNGTDCVPCASACETCTGATSSDCVVCALGTFLNEGRCVGADNVGVCEGTNLIADNNKIECDSCGASCTQCQIQEFNSASTVDQKKCTACIPGFFLNNGTCVESCPSGTTLSSQDNLTCIPCDPSCTSCFASPTFCLTCPNNQLASNGKCAPTCPPHTFASASDDDDDDDSGACLACHADCASCSGGAFNQCTACPAERPVLNGNGRCLPTCSRSQFFDPTSGTCQTCDSSCATCAAAGAGSCLSCAGNGQRLVQGACVAADCKSDTSVVTGLGVCLSDLVSTPSAGADTPPLPPVPGIDTNTTTVESGRRLEWWEILLMALGCAFVFIAVVWCCRRRQRRKRAAAEGAKVGIYTVDLDLDLDRGRGGRGWRATLAQCWHRLRGRASSSSARSAASPLGYLPSGTAHFAPVPAMRSEPVVFHRGVPVGGWRRRLVRWGERLFGHESSQPAVYVPNIVHLGPVHNNSAEDVKAYNLKATATAPSPAARDVDMVKLIESYNRPPDKQHTTPAWREHRYAPVLPTHRELQVDAEQGSLSDASTSTSSRISRMSAPSVYSQLTGAPRRVQDPRVPVRRDLDSRFAVSAFGVALDGGVRAGGGAKGAAGPVPF